MKRKIIALTFLVGVCFGLLAGCSNPFMETAPETTANPYAIKVYSVDELQDDTYYVKHGEDFYEIPFGEDNFKNTDDGYALPFTDSPEARPDRSFFYTKDKTELLIPTVYADDQIIYKSSDSFYDSFSWERYIDGGYTLGVRGISLDVVNKLTFTNFYTNILDDSILEEKLGRVNSDEEKEYNSYTVNAVNGYLLTEENLCNAGYLVNLPDIETSASVDFYDGTHLNRVEAKADTRIFYSFEPYWTKDVEYHEDGYAIIHVPDAFLSGYYKVNNSGMFRYVDQPYSERTDLTKLKYNQAYFKYDEYGDMICEINEDKTEYIYQ